MLCENFIFFPLTGLDFCVFLAINYPRIDKTGPVFFVGWNHNGLGEMPNSGQHPVGDLRSGRLARGDF